MRICPWCNWQENWFGLNFHALIRTLIHCQVISNRWYVLACAYCDSNIMKKTSPTSIGGAPKNLFTRCSWNLEMFQFKERGEHLSEQQEQETGSNKRSSVWLRISNPGTLERGGYSHRGTLVYMEKRCLGSREDHHPPTRATLGNVTVANHLHEEQKRWQDKKCDPPSWVTLLAGQTFLPKSQKTLGTRLRPIRSTPSRSDNRDLTIWQRRRPWKRRWKIRLLILSNHFAIIPSRPVT